MRSWVKRAAVVTCAIAATSMASPAQAVEPVDPETPPSLVMGAGDNPITFVTKLDLPASYDTLTEDEKKYVPTEVSTTVIVDYAAVPAEQPKSMSLAAASATYCNSAWASYTARAAYGEVYKLQINIDRWCYDGGKVLSTYPIRSTASVNNLAMIQGWEFNGIVDKDQWRPNNTSWYYRNYLKANFRYCPIRLGACMVSQMPWVQLDTNGAGRIAYWVGK